MTDSQQEQLAARINALRTFHHVLGGEHKGIAELRMLGSGRGVISGYFDRNHQADFLSSISDMSGKAEGIFVTLNPVNPDLLARASNRMREYAKVTTGDADILERRWLLIDLDPKRPSGVSSTEAEHQAALAKAGEISAWLGSAGWPIPITADSGNGAHLLYRIELPNDESARRLLERALQALDLFFSDEAVQVDRTTFNAARISKVYGTRVRKGDSTPERPHRLSKVITMPTHPEVVSIELLQRLADRVADPIHDAQHPSASGAFDLQTWIDEHDLPVVSAGSWRDGWKWILNPCPFNSAHTNRSAYIVQLGNGAIAAGCHHDGCAKKRWPELRRMFDGGENFPEHDQYHADAVVDSADEWPDPMEIPGVMLSVPSLPPELLPEPLRDWLVDVAERAQGPLEYVSVAAFVGAGSLLGRQVGIRPKQHDTWLVVPNLWGMIVGPPGVLKSPMLSEGLAPLRLLESEAQDEHNEAMQNYSVQRAIADVREKVLRDRIEKAVKEGHPVESLRCELEELSVERPTARRFTTNDATVEKLGELLAENPNGILLVRDELGGLMASMEKPGRESDRAFYLECWSGDSDSYLIDRIGRGSIVIKSPCVSIVGCIPPERLKHYLDRQFEHEGNDGFIQRFQFAIYPHVSTAWTNVDRAPDETARRCAASAFRRIADLHRMFPDLRSTGKGIPFLRFDEGGQKLFNEWRADLEPKLRVGDDHPVLIEHFSKYRSLMPAVALIFHVIEQVGQGRDTLGPVSKRAAAVAAAITDLLEVHARRIYLPITHKQVPTVKLLAERVRNHRLPNPFTARDLYNRNWSGLGSSDEAQPALDTLVERKWLRRVEVKHTGGGRPTTQFHINPKIRTSRRNEVSRSFSSLEPLRDRPGDDPGAE